MQSALRAPAGGSGLPPALDDACVSLYVGNLDPRVTDIMLTDIFRSVGGVMHAKIIPDKNFQHTGLNYGFVDMASHKDATEALEALNGLKMLGQEIKVNWAHQGQGGTRGSGEDTSTHHHVFVGDLSPDVTDDVLYKAFSAFGTLSIARVMWDTATHKSRGYGFLAFRDREDADRAISTMNGEWLGSRSIRVNWANPRSQEDAGARSGSGMDAPPTAPPPAGGQAAGFTQQPMLSYDVVVNQSSPTNITVYIGNLAPHVREADLYPLFQTFGYVTEVRLQHDRGFAFVKMDSHERAATAICYLSGYSFHGRNLRASWGKDKTALEGGMPMGGDYGAYGAGGPAYGATAITMTPPAPPPVATIDPATLPPLSDPIAAAAAAAAQAAVAYQLQMQAQPVAPTADYYAYYSAYYGQQQ
ncbi:hypothetical protein BC828DRAFT_349094 [Blastocladiella britannica]|nr:hypothetical protein BC828DRAFT_349094 [Blastocladiella britannica]